MRLVTSDHTDVTNPDGHRPVKLRKKKNGYVEVKSRIRRKVDKPFKGYVFKRRDSY